MINITLTAIDAVSIMRLILGFFSFMEGVGSIILLLIMVYVVLCILFDYGCMFNIYAILDYTETE